MWYNKSRPQVQYHGRVKQPTSQTPAITLPLQLPHSLNDISPKVKIIFFIKKNSQCVLKVCVKLATYQPDDQYLESKSKLYDTTTRKWTKKTVLLPSTYVTV